MHLAIVVLGTLATCQQPNLTSNQQKAAQVFEANELFPIVPNGWKHLLSGLTSVPLETRDAAGRLDMYITRGTCGSSHTVTGHVLGAMALMGPERKMVFTDYTIRIQNVFRGSGFAIGDILHVYRIGGKVCTPDGTFEMKSDDHAPLEIGQEYLLFLTNVNDAWITGSSSWKLTLGQPTQIGRESFTASEIMTAARGATQCPQ